MRFERAPACEKLSFKIFETGKIIEQRRHIRQDLKEIS